ncbi:hypothetical protein XENOCAPTIV_024401 [Xenoophorus captivus]|uniref:Uncharacterized protein n=1 Tax=Xenoophorus captivus TaxID=1517983 RepID=A0ABV0RKU4_9TELE
MFLGCERKPRGEPSENASEQFNKNCYFCFYCMKTIVHVFETLSSNIPASPILKNNQCNLKKGIKINAAGMDGQNFLINKSNRISFIFFLVLVTISTASMLQNKMLGITNNCTAC